MGTGFGRPSVQLGRSVAADRLGGKMIQDLGPKDFDDFYVRLRANGLSPGSIKRYHSVLGHSNKP